MAQPRQQESGTPDLREFARKAGAAGNGFVAKKRARRHAPIERIEEHPIPRLHSDPDSASDLLTLLSHQLRTPLQAIFGYAELLEREIHGPLTAAQRRDVRGIQHSQQLLLGILNTLEAARVK